jgi:hypothetical protein
MTVALREAKVNAIDKISIATASISDKVGRLNVAVNQVTRVHQLHAL